MGSSVAAWLRSAALLDVPGLLTALEEQADDVRDLAMLQKDEIASIVDTLHVKPLTARRILLAIERLSASPKSPALSPPLRMPDFSSPRTVHTPTTSSMTPAADVKATVLLPEAASPRERELHVDEEKRRETADATLRNTAAARVRHGAATASWETASRLEEKARDLAFAASKTASTFEAREAKTRELAAANGEEMSTKLAAARADLEQRERAHVKRDPGGVAAANAYRLNLRAEAKARAGRWAARLAEAEAQSAASRQRAEDMLADYHSAAAAAAAAEAALHAASEEVASCSQAEATALAAAQHASQLKGGAERRRRAVAARQNEALSLRLLASAGRTKEARRDAERYAADAKRRWHSVLSERTSHAALASELRARGADERRLAHLGSPAASGASA